MKRKVNISKAAQEDYKSAVRYLALQSVGLPARFESALLAFVQGVDKQPERYPLLEADYRIGRLRKFPYNVIYSFDETSIEILALYHHARNPAELTTRLTPKDLDP